MGIWSGVFEIGSLVDVPKQDAQSFRSAFQDQYKDVDAPGIFIHNISIALPMFIPLFGAIGGFVAAIFTGYAIKALEVSATSLNLPALAILYLTPFGIMELFCYGMGTSRSLMLIYGLIKKQPIRKQIKPALIEMGLVVVILVIAGFIEYGMVRHG